MSTSSVFLIEVAGTFYSNTGYAYATIGRTTASTAAGTTASSSTINLGHVRAGGDGTSNDEVHTVASWHHNAHVHTGGFAVYDQPNTTDFIRYCIHFTRDSNNYVYFPHHGLGTMQVTELDGTGTTKVSTNAALEVNT